MQEAKSAAELFDFLAGDKACQMQGVDAAIGHLAGHAGLRRVVTPAHARIVLIGGVGMVAVAEIGDDKPDFSKVTPCNHCPHLPDHRVSAVAVIHRANFAGLTGDLHDLLALLDRHCHRLFAKHVEPGLQKRLGDFEMRGIGCRHGYEIDAVLARALALQHLAPVAISAVRCNAEALRVGTTGLGVVIERSRHERKMSIGLSTEPVCRPDL